MPRWPAASPPRARPGRRQRSGRRPGRAVADEIGGIAVPGDASTIVTTEAREALGSTVDVYCANAGVGSGFEAAEEAVWALAWDVNVMAHVRAAREAVPDWLDAAALGFVSTVSAAGLLTMIGAAPCNVTKRGAYAAPAEWLSLTYRHRPGSRCTPSARRACAPTCSPRAAAPGGQVLQPTAIEPQDVADALFKGIEEDRFLILPHPEVCRCYQARAAGPDRWLHGMNRLQRQWEEGDGPDDRLRYAAEALAGPADRRPEAPLDPDASLVHALHRAAAEAPDRAFLAYFDGRLTYREGGRG